MKNAISRVQEMVAQIKATESTTDAKFVLEEFRRYICNAIYDYYTIVNMCIHTETISNTYDAIYKIIDKDIRDLIENKSRDNQIILLSEIIKRL